MELPGAQLLTLAKRLAQKCVYGLRAEERVYAAPDSNLDEVDAQAPHR
jgi:hypothetical protein